MKRAALAALLFIVPMVASAADARRSVLVTMKPSRIAAEAIARNVDLTTPEHHFRELEIVNGFSASLTEAEIAALQQSGSVALIEEDRPVHAFGTVAPAAQWQPHAEATVADGQLTPYGINMVRAPQAWVAGKGAGVNVAVLDTGVDYKHPELAAVYAGGYNTFTDTNDPMDDHGHGTHCSGIIAAADNGLGVVGVAPAVKLWAVKVLDQDGSGSNSNIVNGLNWVLKQKTALGGNWIVSLSLGSCTPSTTERQAFTNAIANGVMVFAASGNHDPSKPEKCTATENNMYSVNYPAGYLGVNAVGAIDSNSTVATFSNFGPELAFAAPGVGVLSSVRVGTGTWTALTSGNTVSSAPALTGSGFGDVNASYVFCNLGNPADFPASMSGKIALIKRGDLTFHDKALNAKKAGAAGVVIFNKDASDFSNWTLIGKVDANNQKNDACGLAPSDPAYIGAGCHDDPADLAFAWPVTFGMSAADGEPLATKGTGTLRLSNHAKDDYEIESGTSMACPHAAAVAALLWSIAPTATAAQLRTAMINTAHDLGAAGVDNKYGYGLIDAEAAGKQLNPGAFGSGAQPQPQPQVGRFAGRRGH